MLKFNFKENNGSLEYLNGKSFIIKDNNKLSYFPDKR